MQIPESLTRYVPQETEAKKSGSIMGKDDFLRLLVTQLRYQDPQNPVDNSEFTAQLAQFSSLEQMQQISEGFNNLKAVMEQQGRFSLLQTVGKTARTAGDTLVADAAGRRGLFVTNGASSSTRVTISDAAGTPLQTMDLGGLPAGEHPFTWDGTLPGGATAPPGTYRFSVEAADGAGKAVPATLFMEGVVDSISLGESPIVTISGISVPFSNITLWKGGGTR